MTIHTHAITRRPDDLLDVSRLEHGKIELKPERVDLATIAKRAVVSSRPAIKERKHTLTVLLPRKPLMLCADPVRVEQVIVNLLKNAARFTDVGGTIRLAITREANEAVIRVKDNGVGISPEFQAKIFQPFFQADAIGSRSHGGLGLGLYDRKIIGRNAWWGGVGVQQRCAKGDRIHCAYAVDEGRTAKTDCKIALNTK